MTFGPARLGLAFMMAGLAITVWNIIRKPTVRLSRVTWGMMSLLSLAVLLSYEARGVGETIWIARGGLFAACLLFFTTWVKGDVRFGLLDLGCLMLSLLCLPLQIIASPNVSLYLAIMIGSVAFVPTFNKACLNPRSESRTGWTLGFIGTTLNLFALTDFSLCAISHPVYLFAQHSLMMYLLWWRPHRHRF